MMDELDVNLDFLGGHLVGSSLGRILLMGCFGVVDFAVSDLVCLGQMAVAACYQINRVLYRFIFISFVFILRYTWVGGHLDGPRF
jgi:hypothetical protein